MQRARTVRITDLGRIDMVEPVIGHHLAGSIQDHPAQTPALIGVGMHAPVGLVEVFVNARFDIDHGAHVVAQTSVLAAVGDISARGLEVVQGEQGFFDRILDQLDRWRDIVRQLRHHQLRKFSSLVRIEFTRNRARLDERFGDFACIERNDTPIAFQDVLGMPAHDCSSSS